MYRLFLAIRYLLTRPINLLGVGGITIGVWALVVVVSLFSGFLQVLERHVQAATSDIVVSALPPWTEWPALQKALTDDPDVQACAPRLMHYGLLLPPGRRPAPAPLPGLSALHGGDQPFLSVLGVDAAYERETTGLDAWLRSDEIPADSRVRDLDDPLRAGARPTVLLGYDRMQREGIRRGDTLVLTTAHLVPDRNGRKHPRKVQIELEVAGAFRSQHGGFDGNTVFVALETLRQALFPDNPTFVQEVAVRTRDGAALDEVAMRLERRVHRVTARDNRTYGIAQTWRQKNSQLLDSIAHQRTLMKIVLIVIMVVAAFLMLATLSMMVTEKTSDIGILTAMGGTPLGVTTVFLACGMVITAVGVACGLLAGITTAVYLDEIRQFIKWAFGYNLFRPEVYDLTRVPCHIDPLWLVQVAGMALATGFLVSAIPALRAARHDPLVSLRGV